MQKVAVFLDYANIEAASRNTGIEVDYGGLLDYLADESEGRVLQAAYAYVPVDPRLEHAKDRKIEDLWEDGYIVRSKVGTVAGNTYKCDFDIEMTLDIVRTSFDLKPDVVVIASGDSDFVPVVLDLRRKGIRVEVASFDYAMSEILSRRCSGYISLDMLYGNDEAGIDDDNTADIEQEEISAENQPDILEDA
ncbi:MAG: NYN domain-containing protein [Synergistaceae bacterium]|nr:NYN domain-containing protein [Synergistaceae bacterium]